MTLKTRVFDDLKYTAFSISSSKHSADTTASELRKNGFLARVTSTEYGSYSGYQVWIRRK